MNEKWIDVSAHQGHIDWLKVAASGVKGAIIRAGYGNDLSQQDTQFTANIKGAVAAGVKVAIYWFAYPDSVADAQKEWQTCKRVIEPYRNSILFVCYDYEYDSVSYFTRQHGAAPGNTLINSMVTVFLSAVKADGWRTALYTNNDYRLHIFTQATMTAVDYLYLADYSGGPDVQCAIQQTTSSGVVPGISGSVDLDSVFVVIAQTVVEIDTTMDVTKPRGSWYQVKCTCPQQPSLTFGTADVVTILPPTHIGNDWLYYIVPIGWSGQETGIYTAAPGEQPLKRFIYKIA